MADVIRRISVREGYDPTDYTLLAFGGAGGLHACAIAELLKMKSILFPADSGLLSAYGLREAVPERFAGRQIMMSLEEIGPLLDVVLDELAGEGRAGLVEEGLEPSQCVVRRREVQLRYAGQEAGLFIDAGSVAEITDRFSSAYESRYGYSARNRGIEVVSLRVVVSGKPREDTAERFSRDGDVPSIANACGIARTTLVPGQRFNGPVLVQDGFSTLFVSEGWKASVGSEGSILLNDVRNQDSVSSTVSSDVVELELFTCRFLALVEEMGVLLQRCAFSVNVKERLDFSCALLDADGELVANAPHIPVHLGALGICVRRICEALELSPGDVVVTNHPGFGGSHLPDITLVAPVHSTDGVLLGFVANRAHHAEVGGATPGSMPTTAMSLFLAPTALRKPISLVRSVTDTSMMFMMPMPPTMRATPTTPPMTAVTPPRMER
jgi:5-oxoprolinase (ATP-hydrolysing)